MIQYTIHEVAALLNISTDAIRLYEKEGLVTPTRNPENGYRYYNTEQIHRIMGICLYRKLHVSIAEIKRLVEVSTLEDISDGFSGFIDSRKKCSCTVEKHKTWIASPATIPKSGERNRKIHSCMLYLISI